MFMQDTFGTEEIPDLEQAQSYRNLVSAIEELDDIKFFHHKEVPLYTLAEKNDTYWNIRHFMLKNQFDDSFKCIIISDTPPPVKGENSHPKSHKKMKYRWCGIEFKIRDYSVRVVESSIVQKYGILINDQWKYFRSFGNVLKLTNQTI